MQSLFRSQPQGSRSAALPLRAAAWLGGLLALAGCAGTQTTAAVGDRQPVEAPEPTAEAAPLQGTSDGASAVAHAIPPCPRATALDAEAIAAEATCLLRRYVQIDTTNPPGNEQRAVDFLQAFLDAEGIPSTRLVSEGGRPNLVARLARNRSPAAGEGGADAGALMLVHHMDVVPASAEEWRFPPLSATVADGYLWGRGALDNMAKTNASRSPPSRPR